MAVTVDFPVVAHRDADELVGLESVTQLAEQHEGRLLILRMLAVGVFARENEHGFVDYRALREPRLLRSPPILGCSGLASKATVKAFLLPKTWTAGALAPGPAAVATSLGTP